MTLQEIKDLSRNRYKIYGKHYHDFVVYKITNVLDNRCYIGVTASLGKRLKSHLYHGSKKTSQLYLHRALRKHGFKNFNFEIIDIQPSLNDLYSKEKFWISHYSSTDKNRGYNLSSGGISCIMSNQTIGKKINSAKNKRKVFVYDKMGNFLREYNSINECSKSFGVKHCTILSSAKNNNLLKKSVQVFFDYKEKVEPHTSSGYKRTSEKLKNNRNCKTFMWKLTDTKLNKTHIEDGIRKLAITSGYSENVIRSIAYNRNGYQSYKQFISIEKLQ